MTLEVSPAEEGPGPGLAGVGPGRPARPDQGPPRRRGHGAAEPGDPAEFSITTFTDDVIALIEAEGPDTVAAFIGEPLLGTGGIVPPPEGYISKPVEPDVLLTKVEDIFG